MSSWIPSEWFGDTLAKGGSSIWQGIKDHRVSLIKTAGTLYQGIEAQRAGSSNARALDAQGRVAYDQSLAEEARVRREARMQIGRQIAATGEYGGGYEGSSGALLRQSNLLAEMDALNVRRDGVNRAKSLFAQSKAARRGGRGALIGSGLLAGTQLLMGWNDKWASKPAAKSE
jgi:hypothetical protein